MVARELLTEILQRGYSSVCSPEMRVFRTKRGKPIRLALLWGCGP